MAGMRLETELAALRTPLLRFAQLQLRNEGLAEDVVSETLLAILEKPDAFEGRSSLRTYATSLLKFKLIDVLRRKTPAQVATLNTAQAAAIETTDIGQLSTTNVRALSTAAVNILNTEQIQAVEAQAPAMSRTPV